MLGATLTIARRALGRPGAAVGLLCAGALAAAVLSAAMVPGTALATHPRVTLAVLVLAGLAGMFAAGHVLAMAGRNGVAETGLLGGALMAASVLMTAHGIATPGVLAESPAVFTASAWLMWPAMLVALAPLALRTRVPRLACHWREWTGVTVLGTIAVAGGMLVMPSLVSVPSPGAAVQVALVAGGLTGGLSVAALQLRLFSVTRDRAHLAVALGWAALGAWSMVWLGATGALWSWFANAVLIAALVATPCAVLAAHRTERAVMDALQPVLRRDPLTALEVGLTPVLGRFVADLRTKDPLTRDHVTRCAEVTLKVGERCGLSTAELRDLGLAALLHDIGKLELPESLLTHTGRLDAEQWALMQQHAVIGAGMLEAAPSLASVAPIVRWHHERVDGGGYPDGLRGDDIPFGARIVAVCDAYDAMAHTRHYRAGLGHDRAVAVLREHAGAQWDAAVVEVLIAFLEEERDADDWLVSLAAVGRTDGVPGCGCADALPDDIRAHLAGVASDPS